MENVKKESIFDKIDTEQGFLDWFLQKSDKSFNAELDLAIKRDYENSEYAFMNNPYGEEYESIFDY